MQQSRELLKEKLHPDDLISQSSVAWIYSLGAAMGTFVLTLVPLGIVYSLSALSRWPETTDDGSRWWVAPFNLLLWGIAFVVCVGVGHETYVRQTERRLSVLEEHRSRTSHNPASGHPHSDGKIDRSEPASGSTLRH
jgi:hypothetical protein